MRIDGDGRVAKSRIQHHIGCFPANAGQGFKRLTIIRHFTVVQIKQHAAGGDDVFGFGAIQADCFDEFRKPFYAQCQHLVWRWCYREKTGRCLVNPDIGCLCR